MSLRYFINLLVLLAGGFLVVASRTFAPSTAQWLGLGIGVLAVVVAGAGLAVSRPQLSAIGYAVTGLLGLWTIASSMTFTGNVLGWVVFANGLALVAVALGDLTAHEVTTERVVHTLDVRERSELQAAA
jgi:hypothetical protein